MKLTAEQGKAAGRSQEPEKDGEGPDRLLTL